MTSKPPPPRPPHSRRTRMIRMIRIIQRMAMLIFQTPIPWAPIPQTLISQALISQTPIFQTQIVSWRLAFAFARRELRGSIGRFRVFLIALILGVTAIGAVGSVADAMRAGIASNSRMLFGGDLEASSSHNPVPETLRQVMQAQGRLSSIIEMRAMLAFGTDEAGIRRLVNLKAIDGQWPLVGTPRLDPPVALSDALAIEDGVPGIVANPGVLRILGLEVGDVARLGDARVRVGARLITEPDQSFGFGSFAPRVIISRKGLELTGLNAPGALVTYRERLLLNQGGRVDAFLSALRDSEDGDLVRLRHHRDETREFENFINQTETFLTIVSLTTLLIGGLGISSAVRAWLDSRMPTLATLKCIGASSRLIFRIYFIQVMVLAIVGTGIGLMLAALAPITIVYLFGDKVPLPLGYGVYQTALMTAGGLGLLTSIAFSLWPLGKAVRINPAQLFRARIAPPQERPKSVYIIGIGLAAMGLIGLTLWSVHDTTLSVAFTLFILVSFILLSVLAQAVVRLLQCLPLPANVPIRLALTALVRPGNSTRSIIITFGLGLSVLIAVTLAEYNISRQLETRLAEDAPAWFFVDIQPSQQQVFNEVANDAVGAQNVSIVPMTRGRIVALAGVSVNKIDAPASEEWILNGDRGLTWQAQAPENSQIVKGAWWPEDYTGPMLTSMDDEAMVAFGLDIGDTITISVAGREMVATIASSREIDWRTFGLNFVFIMSPGEIKTAPHTLIATVNTNDPVIEASIDRKIALTLPNVSSISVREAVNGVLRVINLVSRAIQTTAVLTLISGFAVLAGTIAASEARRINTSVILKVLGATRRVILLSYILEYSFLGIVTGGVAVVIGTLASIGLVIWFIGSAFVFAPLLVVSVVAGGIVATTILGLAGAARILGQRPASVLRN